MSYERFGARLNVKDALAVVFIVCCILSVNNIIHSICKRPRQRLAIVINSSFDARPGVILLCLMAFSEL